MDERNEGRRGGLARGREVSSAVQWVLFVSNVSLLGFRRHTVLLVLVHHHPPWQPPRLTSDGFVPRLLTPMGAAITVTDTSKPRVGGFGCSSSYPADCEAGCTLTVVSFLIKDCSAIVVAFGRG